MVRGTSNKQKGFTLIEMAVVMVIAGLLFAFLGSALIAYVQKAKITTTEKRIEEINDALAQYLNINRRYPCVAPTDVAPDTGGFGVEVGACNVGAIAGTIETPGAVMGAGGVRIGSVPTRTLNLPDEFSVDGWGQRFTYAVSMRQATDNPSPPGGTMFTSNGGAIGIEDSTGNSIYPAAHYVLVSHGASKEGAFLANGNGRPVGDCTSGSLDNENCNDDATFLTTLVTSDRVGAAFYDDYLSYQGQTMPAFDPIPVGAVMAFDLASCPAGWTAYAPAASRFVVGFGPNIALTSYDLAPLGGVSTAAAPVSTLGSSGTKDDRTMMPPYVALLYCQKD